MTIKEDIGNLFDDVNPDIRSQVNQKSFIDKLAQRARIAGKQINKATKPAQKYLYGTPKPGIIGNAQKAFGTIGRPLALADAGGEIYRGVNKLNQEDKDFLTKLAAAGDLIGGTFDAGVSVAPASKLNPYVLGAYGLRKGMQGIGHLIDSNIEKANQKAVLSGSIMKDPNKARELIAKGYMVMNDNGVLVPTDKFYKYISAAKKEQEQANQLPSWLQDYNAIDKRNLMVGNNGGAQVQPTSTGGQELRADKMTDDINRMVAQNGVGATGGAVNPVQNTNIQPEVSAINPTGTLPQNEQSISGVDLSGLIGQPNAATQEYINKILEFAKNYQQNAINDNRRNLALAMIAKGTHNPYLMQAGKIDTNKQSADQLELIKAAYEAQNKPLEQARLAYAFQAAGMNPAFAYLPTQALSAYASMYGSNLGYAKAMQQIQANKDLAEYKTASDLAKLEKEYGLKETLKVLEYRFKTSGEYVKANVVANAARNITDPMQMAKLFNKYGIDVNSVMPTDGQNTGGQFATNEDLEE